MSISDFVPPVIKNAIKSAYKTYKTYDDALNKCGSEGYEYKELCDVVSKKTLRYVDELKKVDTREISVGNLNVVNQIQRLAGTQKSLTVCDFGGGCGAHYFEIKRFIPNSINLKWIVVETPQMVSSAREYFEKYDELTFTSSFESLDDIDIFYASGSLQYTSNPIDIVKKIVALSPKIIIFSRTILSNTEENIITIQKSLLSANGHGRLPDGFTDKSILYPHTATSVQKFSNQLDKKYRLFYKINTPDDDYYVIQNTKIDSCVLCYELKGV